MFPDIGSFQWQGTQESPEQMSRANRHTPLRRQQDSGQVSGGRGARDIRRRAPEDFPEEVALERPGDTFRKGVAEAWRALFWAFGSHQSFHDDTKVTWTPRL